MGRVSSLFDSILHRRKPAGESPQAMSDVEAELEEALKQSGLTGDQLRAAHENWDPDDPRYSESLREVDQLRAALDGVEGRDDLLRRLDEFKRRRDAGSPRPGTT